MRTFRTKERHEGGWIRFDKVCIDNNGLSNLSTYQRRFDDPDTNNTYHDLLTRWPVIPDGLLEACALYHQPGCTYRNAMSLNEFITKLGFEV